MKILVVEDERKLSDTIVAYLEGGISRAFCGCGYQNTLRGVLPTTGDLPKFAADY